MKMSDPDTASTSREDETTLREKDVSFQSIAGLSIKQCWFFVVGFMGKNYFFKQTYVCSIPNSKRNSSGLINLSMCFKGHLFGKRSE